MPTLPRLFALAVILAGTAAYGQSSQSPPASENASAAVPKPVAKEPVKNIRDETDAWFKDCKLGWDAGTHMSKRDYERTCLRMAQERVKFMRDWEKTGGDYRKAK